MAKKAFNPYAKGIPEKKTFPSRYESVRDTTVPGGPGPAAGKAPSGGETPASRNVYSAGGSAGSPSGAAAVPGAPHPAQGHASTRVPGAGKRPSAPPVDRDLLDGLEGNHRRQRGWGEDSKPDELVDGISITPISKEELKKRLAAQKSGGFLGGKNL